MKNILYKIIGLDLETQKRAIVSIVTYFVDGLYLFGGIQVSDEKVDYVIKGILAIVTALVWIRGFYMNENYTPAGCEGTGYTRLRKEQEKLIDMNEDPEFEGFEMEDMDPIDEDIVGDCDEL